MILKAVIFDFDGTLTKQGSIDFKEIRSAIGCPADIHILKFIETLPFDEQKKAMAILEKFEQEAAEQSTEEDHAQEIIELLNIDKIPICIITRNSRKSVLRSLKNFSEVQERDFFRIISRDDHFPVKPDPASFNYIADLLNIKGENILVVGDYIHDIEAGSRAGCKTVYKITDRPNDHLVNSDYTIHMLKELIPILNSSLPLKCGKYPNNRLDSLLKNFDTSDPKIIIGPGIGEDTAAIDIKDNEIILVKSDPITFNVENIAEYAVNINMNDIATSGGLSRWMTVVLLFPRGIYPDEISTTMKELGDICRKNRLYICGGHTEITESVIRPVISCTIIGTTQKKNLIEKKRMRPGDTIIMTGYAGLEGTSIISREYYNSLINTCLNEKEMRKCIDLIKSLSIINHSKLAVSAGQVTAIHDVTEGGVATALTELSIAGKYGFNISMKKIPIMKETKKICDYFNINPLGLISSGAMILCCRETAAENILHTLNNAKIHAVKLGNVSTGPAGKIKCLDADQHEWPEFERDELTKL